MTKILTLTGPPAVGKSTITDMLEDMGIPVVATGDAMRSYAEKRGAETEDEIWSEVQNLRADQGKEAPTVVAVAEVDLNKHDIVCISDLREQAELDYLRSDAVPAEPVLSARVDAPLIQRIERYVDRELENDNAAVSTERVEELRSEYIRREEQEMPYPDHDIIIDNRDNVTVTELWQHLERFIDFSKP